MTAVVRTIIVELNGYKPASIDVSQGDRGSRAVSCRLMADGAPWIVPAGTAVRVAYTLPDGTPGHYATLPDGNLAGTVDGHTVTVVLEDRIMERSGVAEVSVVLDDGQGGQLATWPIRVHVQGGPASNTHPEELPQLGAEYEGRILFVSGGVVTPLQLGPGLSIRDGVLYVRGASPEEPVGVITTEVVDGDFRVYLDGVEVAPAVDAAGDLTWPGLLLNVDADGNGTLAIKEV